MKAPKIPAAVAFPFGFKVPVVSVEQLKEKDGQYVMKNHGGPYIDLADSQPLWQKYQTFAHELVHAAIDFDLWVQRAIVEPMKEEAEQTAKELKEGERDV